MFVCWWLNGLDCICCILPYLIFDKYSGEDDDRGYSNTFDDNGRGGSDGVDCNYGINIVYYDTFDNDCRDDNGEGDKE